jgi:CubicO group peptidase (beta-lactamase class C family)
MIRRCTRLVSPPVDALRQIDEWGAEHAAAGIVAGEGVVARHGDPAHVYRWASVTKLVTALAVLVALEEGTVELETPAGPPGSTIRHLLAHASGLPFDDGPPIAAPATRRIYSNHGFEVLARAVGDAAEMPFADYAREAVLQPLGLGFELGSAADGIHASLGDLLRVAQELLAPTLVAAETLAEATTVVFPGLSGVLPGIGRMEPLDWGLGFELRGAKRPHWTGEGNSPRTYGHFGGAGTFLWVDPDAELALGCLTDRAFDDWALAAWPPLADAVLAAARRA